MRLDLQMIQNHIGVDIIEISRISQAINRWQEKFLSRIYTGRELELYRNNTESLAARFAGKEAVMKALCLTSLAGSWLEIEILAEPDGKPTVKLYGHAAAKARILGVNKLEISLSHSRENAIALVLGVKEV